MPRMLSLALSTALVAGLALAAPALAGTTDGTVTAADTSDSCYAGQDGTCSGGASAGLSSFSGSARLDSPDSPFTRSTRYSQTLARHTIGFDLAEPTTAADISVTLHLDEATASWTQTRPQLFGGTSDDRSGSRVLFQLLGHSAPSDCGCGWFIQGSPNVVAASVDDPSEEAVARDETITLTMNATNPYGDKVLPAGRYEVLLRTYALNDLYGAGDWGTLSSSFIGTIRDVTVTTPDAVSKEASNLTLSLSGTGAKRTLTATLTDADGTPLDGRTISFFADGELIGTDVTEGGAASLGLNKNLRKGSHTFTAEFAGDDLYEASTAELTS